MLSIKAMGHNHGEYYLTLAREAYFLEGGEPPGRWLGEGAAALGLTDTVEADALRILMKGFSPDGSTALIQNAGKKEHQPGWDLTLSSPKSLSVLWSQSDPMMRAMIQEAHFQAVRATVSYLESCAAITRRGKAGMEREAAGLVVAAFEHGTSRASDPQLHSHLLVLNIGVRRDDTTGTIMSKPLYLHKMPAGALFRAELAAQLRRLGLPIRNAETGFAIEGVPETLCTLFSTRRQEIEAALAAEGLSGARAAAVAALATRPTKEQVPREELFRRWQAVGQEYGFGIEQARALVHAVPSPEPLEQAARDALLKAVAQITETHSHFSEREVVRRLAEAAPGIGLGAAQVRATVAAFLPSREVVHLGSVRGEARFTTREMVELEVDMLEVANRLHLGFFDGLNPRTVEQVRAARPNLTSEQTAALIHITRTSGRLKVLTGMAGSGKTHAVEAIRVCFEQSGYQVIGTALSAKAARGLAEGAGIASKSVQAALHDLEGGRVKAAERRARSPEEQPALITPRTLLVVDEASMLGTRQMERLLSAVEQGGGHILLVGDSRQLQPIEAGGPFEAISALCGQAELTQIMRQRKEWARTAVRQFADGEAKEALADYAERGLLRVSSDRHQALNALIADWQREGIYRPREHLILANTNAEVTRLNQMAQQARLETGISSKRHIEVGEIMLYEHDRVMFTRNSRLVGVQNGDMGTVKRIDPVRQTLTVMLDSGAVVTISVRTYQYISLGYACSVYKAQGLSVPYAYVLLGGAMQDREHSYVQVSRAREATRLYVDAAEAGEDLTELVRLMGTSHRKNLAVEVLHGPQLRVGALAARLGR